MNKGLKGLILLIFFFSCKEKVLTTVNQSSFKSSIETTLDKKIPLLQKEYNVPAIAIGIIENGEIRFTKVYGEHQLGKKAPQNTIFNVASITKTMLTMTILKLIDNKQWNLDESLSKYWVDKDIKDNPWHQKLTTRHVLGHTTGFKNWRRMHPENKLTFEFEPGIRYQYSGEGFEYLSFALEKKLNIKWNKLVDSLIFKPMKMKDANLSWLKGKDTLRFAHWYDGKGKLHNEYYKTHWVTAADDLLVTIEDLTNFCVNMMSENILSKKLYSEMVKTQSKIHDNANQGLGWTVVNNLSNGEYLINHDGGDTGVAATIILLPKSKNGIIVLTNGDNGSIICKNIVKESINIGKEIIEKIYWGAKVPKTIKIPETLLNTYIGEYESSLGRKISFHKKANGLLIDGVGIPQLTLFPKSENTFFPMDFEILFVFKKDKKGSVNGFDIIQSGKVTLSGVKK